MKLLNRLALGATIGSVAAAGGYRWYQSHMEAKRDMHGRTHVPRKKAARKASKAHHRSSASHAHQPTNAAVAA